MLDIKLGYYGVLIVSKINFEETGIAGMKLVHPFVAEDNRGYFAKFYEHEIFFKNGIPLVPFEENQSKSKKGTIRGLHFQKKFSQDKLIQVLHGEIFDVGVDLRKSSPTFGQWRGYKLSDKNRTLLYIPKGFAHGFLALTDDAVIHYLAGDKYDPESDGGILWNDQDVNVKWPLEEVESLITSEKDQHLQSFQEFKETFKGFDV